MRIMFLLVFALALAFQGQGSGQGRAGGGPASVLPGGASTAPPQVLEKFDPEYTQEALDAKYEGTVALALVITTDGKASEISVVRPIGMGLNEKAVECVQK